MTRNRSYQPLRPVGDSQSASRGMGAPGPMSMAARLLRAPVSFGAPTRLARDPGLATDPATHSRRRDPLANMWRSSAVSRITAGQVTMATVCKTVGFAYPGSNPGPATAAGTALHQPGRGGGLLPWCPAVSGRDPVGPPRTSGNGSFGWRPGGPAGEGTGRPDAPVHPGPVTATQTRSAAGRTRRRGRPGSDRADRRPAGTPRPGARTADVRDRGLVPPSTTGREGCAAGDTGAAVVVRVED